jgi:hypothetical protein
MKIFSLLETQYEQFSQSVKNYLSKTLSGTGGNYSNSSVFGQLINVLGAVVQNIMLYIEDSLVEQNKYTAQRKKSIYGLAALSGYQPSLGKATGVQLKLNFTPSVSKDLNVVINNHQKLVCTQNGLHYNIILPQEVIVLSIEKDASTRYLYAVQGKFESQTFIVSGGKYYVQNFKFNGHLDPDYIQVKVNDEIWSQTASVYDMDPNGNQYTYRVNPTNGVDIVFGNGAYGKSLQSDDVVEVTYLLHDGEMGNLDVNEETYFIFDDNLVDISGEEVNGNMMFNVTFATNDSVSSGTNSESVEQVRNMIGLNSRALVLASPNHYKTFINKFSFCGYNRTWSEPGSMVINSLIMRNYKMMMKDGKDYFNLTENDFKLNDIQKHSIIDSIEKSGNQLAGITYKIHDPELCKYALYLYIKLKSTTYDYEYIENHVRKLVGEFFADIQSDEYIPKSDIINLLKSNISAIDGVNAYFLSERNETAMQTKQYVDKTTYYDPSTGTFKTKTENVYLYDGENPNLGLDGHGNIYLKSDNQFPVLLGGWDFVNKEGQEVTILNPLIITFE